MTSINDTFVNALLADASYVNNLIPGLTDVALKNALSTRMTPTLAKFIGENFTVVTSINTPDDIVNGAGFDGVIWRGNAGTPYAGKVFVSMRGTKPGASFVTVAGSGADVISGDAGHDVMFGNSGDDAMYGGAAVYGLVGGAGDDEVSGNAGDDYLFVDLGADTLRGSTEFKAIAAANHDAWRICA